jgi:hypothetical protein
MTAAILAISEKQLQEAVIELAEWLGWLSYHTYDSRRSQPGFPDLILVRRDRCIAVELKSERGKVTADQQTWLDALATAGIVTAVWRPIDWHRGEIERCLR